MKTLNKYFVKISYRKNGQVYYCDAHVRGYNLRSEEGIDKLRRDLSETYQADDYSVVIEFIWRLNQ